MTPYTDWPPARMNQGTKIACAHPAEVRKLLGRLKLPELLLLAQSWGIYDCPEKSKPVAIAYLLHHPRLQGGLTAQQVADIDLTCTAGPSLGEERSLVWACLSLEKDGGGV